MPNDDWEEIIGSSGWFSPFTRCGPGGGGATWLSSRWGRCCDPPLSLFQSNGFKFPWNWDDHETSRKDVNYFVYSIHYIHGGPESIPGPPWFSHGKLQSFQWYLRRFSPKVLSWTLGTDHPLLLVAKPGEEIYFPPRVGWMSETF